MVAAKGGCNECILTLLPAAPKPTQVKDRSKIKSSQQRGIRQALLDQFPKLEPYFEQVGLAMPTPQPTLPERLLPGASSQIAFAAFR